MTCQDAMLAPSKHTDAVAIGDTGLRDLPDGWATTTLGAICHNPEYGWTTKAVIKPGGMKLLRTTDVSKGPIDWATVPFCDQDPPSLNRFLLRDGDIVISRAGSVGVSALIQNCPESVFASYLIRFRPNDCIDAKYIHNFLGSPSYWDQISQQSAGIALQNVNAKKLSALTISLPPLPEQHRIVAEIETQFTRLDASVAALKRAQANLKRYRASVLKSACEGRLVPTEAELVRSEGRDYESAYVPSLRMVAESPAKYTVDYVSGEAADPTLPERWKQQKLSDICLPVEKVTPRKAREETFTYIDIASIDNSIKKIASPKNYLGKDAPSRARQKVKTGSTLFSTVRTYLRNIAMVPPEYDGQVASTGFCVLNPGPQTDANFIFYAVQNDEFIRRLNPIQRGTSYPAVRNSDVMGQWIMLPPLAEQRRIVAEVERRLSVIQQAEATVEASLKRAERLRQSILKQAFSGKLVPQDPNDEPASTLLERIRAEREAAQADAERKRTRRRTTQRARA